MENSCRTPLLSSYGYLSVASDNNPDIEGPPQHTSPPQALNRGIKHDFDKTKLRGLISNFQSIKAKRDHGTYCVTVYRVIFALFCFRPPSLENGFVCLKMAQESCLSGVNWSSFTIENRGNTTVRQWRVPEREECYG